MPAPVRRYLSPAILDWEFVRGSRREDGTMTSCIVYSLSLRFGSSPAMPTAGSKLHLIQKATDQSAIQAKREIERCLAVYLADGRISSMNVTVQVATNPGGAYLDALIDYIDGTGQSNRLKFGIRPGGDR